MTGSGSVPILDANHHLKTKHIDVPAAALVGTPASALAAAVQALVNAGVNALLGNATPANLDTLREIADAIGDDPNFAGTLAASIGARPDRTELAATYVTHDQSIIDALVFGG